MPENLPKIIWFTIVKFGLHTTADLKLRLLKINEESLALLINEKKIFCA
jgi:hypothetical protein